MYVLAALAPHSRDDGALEGGGALAGEGSATVAVDRRDRSGLSHRSDAPAQAEVAPARDLDRVRAAGPGRRAPHLGLEVCAGPTQFERVRIRALSPGNPLFKRILYTKFTTCIFTCNGFSPS